MIGKIDWTQYLHDIRRREIGIVFSLLAKKRFAKGLEIGAGDGFQTTLLASYVENLISSDLNFNRIKLKVPAVEYRILDADLMEGVFEPNTFYFIFSSNVLEHVRDPLKVLRASQPMLTDNGYAVHIVPNRLMKIFYVLFYYPDLFLLFAERLFGRLEGKPFFRGAGINLENNINKVPKPAGRFKKFLLPSIHGNFASHWEEFKAFGRKAWEEKFMDAGYWPEYYAKGPIFSGFGFGIPEGWRRFFESLGLSSEHIFILRKMSQFESMSWAYAKNYLSHGSFRDQRKFFKDWLKKEKSAKAFFKDFLLAVGDPRDKKVLDIGFGNGIMAEEFIKAGALVYGLETEEDLVKMSGNQNLHLYDGRKFPFDSNTFDYAYSTSVLEHMSYPEEVIKEICRTLKPGGKFYLSFPNRYAPKETHTGLWFIGWLPRFKSKRLEDWNLHFVSFFKLKRMARGAGLEVIYDTRSSSPLRGAVKKLLARFGIHYGILLKTIIVVLEKK